MSRTDSTAHDRETVSVGTSYGRVLVAAAFLASVMIVGTISNTGGAEGNQDKPLVPRPPWPEWVHRHWVWENEGTSESATQLVSDYLERGIPVGAVIVDRPWATEPNTFEPDPKRYPKLGEMIAAFHARDVRVMMWVTSTINENASNYAEAKEQDYFLNDGRTIKWWGGRGSFIDYSDPAAVEWWHGQMDKVLDLQIDGWKCDGTDPFIMLLGQPRGDAGPVNWESYRDASYRDFFEYTRKRLGPDRVISARPCDDGGRLPVPMPFAPRDVNFAGWVGDQDGTFGGMRAALRNMSQSSKLNYVNFGSDIGGFRGSGLRDREVMIRWEQLGALCPIMENGGGGEHRPWKYDAEVEQIYKTFALLHQELIPYFYSRGAKAWASGTSMMSFIDEHTYLLGDDFLVAAMVEPGTTRTVQFPPGRWRQWLDESKLHDGAKTEALQFPLDQFPVFVRDDSIIPLDVRDATTGHGGAHCRDSLTLAAYPSDGGRASLDVCESASPGARFSYRQEGNTLLLESTAIAKPLLWRIYGWGNAKRLFTGSGDPPIKSTSVNELTAQKRGWTTTEQDVLWIRIEDAGAGVSLKVER